MRGFSINAWRRGTYVPLAELLLAMGLAVLHLNWKLSPKELSPEPGSQALGAIPRGCSMRSVASWSLGITPPFGPKSYDELR